MWSAPPRQRPPPPPPPPALPCSAACCPSPQVREAAHLASSLFTWRAAALTAGKRVCALLPSASRTERSSSKSRRRSLRTSHSCRWADRRVSPPGRRCPPASSPPLPVLAPWLFGGMRSRCRCAASAQCIEIKADSSHHTYRGLSLGTSIGPSVHYSPAQVTKPKGLRCVGGGMPAALPLPPPCLPCLSPPLAAARLLTPPCGGQAGSASLSGTRRTARSRL